MLTNIELLSTLCAAPGVAGFEKPVTEVISSFFQSREIDTRLDRIGNLIAHIPGEGPRALLFAHCDEVGMLIRKIHPDGFLYIERVGGAPTHILSGQRVQIWTCHGPLAGVIGACPQHLHENNQLPQIADLYIDIGVRSLGQAMELGIEVGSPVTFAASFSEGQGRISAKSLDDRLGCYLLMQLAEKLLVEGPACDLYLAFVVQEETLLRGAEPVTYELQPDWAIGVDATLAFDTPDLVQGQNDISLGKGTVIKVMDHLRGQGLGFIPHLDLRQHIESRAKAEGIPFQREVVTGLSTAASPLPYIRSGLPVAAISFPLRYSHSPIEMVDDDDVKATLNLLEAIIRHPWQG